MIYEYLSNLKSMVVASYHSVIVTIVNRDLLGDLLRDLITDLPGHLDGNLNWDILAALLGDLLGHLVALLDRHTLALLVVSVSVALLLVGRLAGRLVDGVALLLVFGLIVSVINCVTLLFVDCFVDGLVGGFALLFAITTIRMRSSGAEAKEGKNDEDCRLHVVSRTRNSVV